MTTPVAGMDIRAEINRQGDIKITFSGTLARSLKVIEAQTFAEGLKALTLQSRVVAAELKNQ